MCMNGVEPEEKEHKAVSVARVGTRSHPSDHESQSTTHDFGRTIRCRVGEVSNRVIVWV